MSKPQLNLPLVDPATAALPVRATLAGVAQRYGFVPNLYKAFANAPSSLDAYLALGDAFGRASLTATERNLVLLAVSRENECTYCVAAHSTVADMQKDAPDLAEAIRTDAPIADARLEALRRLAEALVRGRGYAAKEVAAFLAAGYAPAQVLEVVVGISMKTLSNYTNHLVHPPLDEAFRRRAWTSPTR